MYEKIPDELKRINHWVCVRNGSKAPMMATEPSPASTRDPSTWSTFEQAVQSVEAGHYDGIGFVFDDDGIVGIDIDCGYDDEGFMSTVAADIIGSCQSYTETSRSGRGFHILLYGALPWAGKNNRNGIEAYRSGRYFIMTGNTVLYEDMVVNQAGIDHVVETYFQTEDRGSNGGNGKRNADRVYSPEWDKPSKTIPVRPKYPVITSGSRNLCLTSLAGILRNAGYTAQQMLQQLIRCNEAACRPQLEVSEIRSIVSSVRRYRK